MVERHMTAVADQEEVREQQRRRQTELLEVSSCFVASFLYQIHNLRDGAWAMDVYYCTTMWCSLELSKIHFLPELAEEAGETSEGTRKEEGTTTTRTGWSEKARAEDCEVRQIILILLLSLFVSYLLSLFPRFRTVLKSPWIRLLVLKSPWICIKPWKVLEFLNNALPRIA